PRWRPPLVRVARGSARWRPVASYPGRPSAHRRFGPRDLRVHLPTALHSRCSLVGASHQRRPRHGVLGGSLGCTPQRLVEQLRFAADLADEFDHILTTIRFSQRHHHHSTTNEHGNWLLLVTTGAVFATTPLRATGDRMRVGLVRRRSPVQPRSWAPPFCATSAEARQNLFG